MVSSTTRVIQVTNIAPQATKDQMQTLFGYLGKIDDIRLYPTIRDVSCPVQSRICYVKYYDSTTVDVAQHLTNTVFIDRALIVIPVQNGEIPDEHKALEMSNNGTLVPGLNQTEPRLPLHVVNSLEGVPPNQVIQTNDPTLTANGLPGYPALPASYDSRKIEEIRRTILVVEVPAAITGQQLVDCFANAGEIKYMRFCERDADKQRYALIEFSEQDSILKALRMSGTMIDGQMIRVGHATQAIAKPQTKSNEAAQREIEEAMCRVKEAQTLISAAIDPMMGLLAKDKRRSRSRSRRRSRSGSRSRRSHSRSRRRSRRSRSRSAHRSRRSRRSRSRSSRRSSRSRHSRSRSRHKSSRSKKDRSKDRSDKKKIESKEERKSKTPAKEIPKEEPKVEEPKVVTEAVKEEEKPLPPIPEEAEKEKAPEKTETTVEEKKSASPDKKRSHSKDRKRSRSRDRKRSRSKDRRRSRSRSRRSRDRKRSKSRDRRRSKSRSRRRSRSRDRKRSRSRDRKRTRSRDRKRTRSRDRKRSRSRDRKRSRSRDRRRTKSRDRKSKSTRKSKSPSDSRKSKEKREPTPKRDVGKADTKNGANGDTVARPENEGFDNGERHSPDNMDISNSP